MKKKVLITIFIIFILLLCSVIGICNFISPEDDVTTLAEENTINEDNPIENNIVSNEVEQESIAETTETNIETETPKQDEVTIQNTSSNATTSTTTVTNKNTTSTTNNSNNTGGTSYKTATSTSNVQSTQTTEQATTKSVEQDTETKTTVEVTRCTNNNNHGMDVGNSGKWFNTKDEAIAYYEEKINYWGKLWENYEIEDSEYYKNCPKGYEIWSCMYCSKWTINFYYR